MPESIPAPDSAATSTLEAVRKHAKRQLRRARGGDPALLAALRLMLPRLAALGDSEVASQLKLADIHHALAREHGLASWGELKRHLEQLDPIHVQAARFLAAVRDGNLASAQALAERHPALASYNLPCAVALGNAGFTAAQLQGTPALATAPHPGDGWEPLLYACHSPLCQLGEPYAGVSLQCVQLLLDAGASPNAHTLWDPADPGSKLPALYFACASNNAPVVKLLLERGADPNDGESIYHSVQDNHFACAELLIAHGADISGKHSRYDNTPLYFLAGYFEGTPDTQKYLDGIRWLLEHGADPNVASYTAGETPLHRAATFNHGVPLAELLLAHGAEVDAPREDGRTPYALAVRSHNIKLAEYLLKNGADSEKLQPIDMLIGWAMAGSTEMAGVILAKNTRLINTLTDEDQQSVANAAWLGRTKALRVFAELGFPLDVEGAAGGTPLHAAAWHGNAAAVRELLALGAPVNVRDKTYGSSPLAWAAHGSTNCQDFSDEDYCETVRLLLDAGSDRTTSINKWNEPPESMASKAVVQIMREKGFTSLPANPG